MRNEIETIFYAQYDDDKELYVKFYDSIGLFTPREFVSGTNTHTFLCNLESLIRDQIDQWNSKQKKRKK